jgi:hypothetical protein
MVMSCRQNFFFVYFIQQAKGQLYLGFRWSSFAYLCGYGDVEDVSMLCMKGERESFDVRGISDEQMREKRPVPLC